MHIPDEYKCFSHPCLDRLVVTSQCRANTTMGDTLIIWNSDLSVTIEMNHISRQISGEHTFDHLDIVRNEADIILNFKARVSRIFEDKVTGAYMVIDLQDRQFYK
jgi:hypothetical protein